MNLESMEKVHVVMNHVNHGTIGIVKLNVTLIKAIAMDVLMIEQIVVYVQEWEETTTEK